MKIYRDSFLGKVIAAMAWNADTARAKRAEEQGRPVDLAQVISDRERLAKSYGERAHYWQKRAEKAELAILALFSLADSIDGHVPEELDPPDFEDPMPLPGVSALIRNNLRLNGFERAP